MRPSKRWIPGGAHTEVVRADVSPAPPAPRQLDELFRQAYERLHDRLLEHAERSLDPDRACDAVYDALAELHDRWPQIWADERVDGYAFRMVQHRVVDALRADDRRVPLDDMDETLEARGAAPFDGEPTESDLGAILDHAFAAMPPKRREAFLLIREENIGYEEAAEILGVSRETVKSHMKSALADLRAAFTRAGIRVANQQEHRLLTPPGGAIDA